MSTRASFVHEVSSSSERRPVERRARDGRRRVAIIGGGIAGLTAAYELSRTPELRARFDVTVHQMGFRLGGKLASGRNRDLGFRNEEHGLHVWFGFYDNTFRLAREVYERWRAPDGCPFRGLEDIVRPHHHALLAHRDGDEFHTTAVHFPKTCDEPGDEPPSPTALGVATGLLDVVRALVATAVVETGEIPKSRLRALAREVLWPDTAPFDAALLRRLDRLAAFVRRLSRKSSARLARIDRDRAARRVHALLAFLHPEICGALERWTRARPSRRPQYHLVDTLFAFGRGMLNERDRIYLDGDLDRVNDRDLRDWLIENGASHETAHTSTFIEAAYDSSFQYLDGERERPSFEAGTATRYIVRAFFAYKRCPAYMIQGGMGEVLIAPLYEVLRDQGVHFEFFRRLDRLELSADQARVARLHFAQQARVRGGRYEPLFTHGGLRCWPTAPDFDQLVAGDRLAAAGVDFESRWSPEGLEDAPVVLEAGRDFDLVVLALPLGSIAPDADGRTPCREWLASNPRIHAAATGINLVPSVAAQFWFRPSMSELGWERNPAIVSWAQPLSIWSDMSPVLAHEGWPLLSGPSSTVYLCGVSAAEAPRASSSERTAPATAHARALAAIEAQLSRHGAAMWPGARTRTGEFDWSALYDPEGRTGPARLRAQYVRVNAEPWDLCDGAAVGNGKLRPAAHESGLANVALASTWTRTSVGTSAVEAAVMSGIAAARALGAEGRAVLGESFMCTPPPVERIEDADRDGVGDEMEVHDGFEHERAAAG